LKPATLRCATLCLLLAAASAHASAQTRSAGTPALPSLPASQPAAATTNADEDFELNIDVRHINESDFHAETAVEVGDARGLAVKVGVALRADDIDVLLRNVHGHVRFRATLGPVQRLLDALRDAQPTQTQPTTTPQQQQQTPP
jgi:hypothetical protein